MEQILVGYFLNSMWQLLLLAAGAWLLVRVLRPGPRVQHRLWIALLPLALVLPLLSLHSGSANVPPAPARSLNPTVADLQVTPTPMESPALRLVAPEAAGPHLSRRHRDPVSAARPRGSMKLDEPNAMTSDPPAIQTPAPAPATISPSSSQPRLHWPPVRELHLGPSATRWIAAFYLATIAFALFRLLFGLITARRVLAHAEPAALNPSQSNLLDQCCARLGVPRPEVLETAAAHSPMVVGFARPALLLPQGYASHPPESALELEAVWLHELAHLRRGDSLANLLCRLLALPMAYHPATWAVEHRIRQTREMLCDAIAAAEMQSTTGYARCLVALARTLQVPGTMTAQFDGAAMFDGTSLEERIMQLIEAKNTVTLRTRTLRFACAASVIVAIIAVAATFHVTPTLAQSPSLAAEVAAVSEVQSAPDAAPLAATDHSNAKLDEARSQFEIGMQLASDAVNRAINRERFGLDIDAQRSDLRWKIEDSQLQSEAARKAWTDAMRASVNAQIRASVDARVHANQAIVDGAEIKREIALAQAQANNPEVKKQIDEAIARLNNPEFKKQMEDAKAKFNSPEFKEQMKKFNSPEFKKQMDEARVKIDSPEFRKQMEDALAKFNSPEFKKQMVYLNSPEFKKNLDLQKQIYINRSFLDLPQFREQMEKVRATLDSPELRENLQKLDSAELTRQLNDLHKELDQLREQLQKDRGDKLTPEDVPAP